MPFQIGINSVLRFPFLPVIFLLACCTGKSVQLCPYPKVKKGSISASRPYKVLWRFVGAFYQVEEAPLHFYFSEIFFFVS